MAVQIINDMPDAEIHRGDPGLLLRDWMPAPVTHKARSARPAFIAITIGLHAFAVVAFLSVQYVTRQEEKPEPIIAEIFEAPAAADDAPPLPPPPMVEIQYMLPPPDVAIETESINSPPVTTNAIAQSSAQVVLPPVVESVEYVRAPAPVYPRESSRRRESGTVLLRVLVDSAGRPAQIRIERSSGFERLDLAARDAVQKALFRPYEVNGVAQASQVLIPIEFTRRAG